MHRIVIVFLFIVCAGYSQSDTVFHVNDIRVKGNVRTNEDAIIIRSKLKIDSWIQVPGIQTIQAIKNLWETGDFKSVEIYRENAKNGIILTIHVEEYYPIGKINYIGISNSEERRLRENEMIKKRTVYNPQTLKIIEKEVTNLLVDKGYAELSISLDSVNTVDDKVNLVYKISKGRRYRVGKVAFKNDYSIPSRKYSKALKEIRSSNWYWPGSLYAKKEQEEVDNIESVAQNRGYLYAEIDSVTTNKMLKKVDIFYHFNESKQYKLGNISWEGNKVIGNNLLNELYIKIKGSDYSQLLINELLYFSEDYSDVSSLYYEKGYADMRLQHVLIPNDSLGTVDIKVIIYEGNVMTYGEISFSGNVRTKDYVMLREVLTTPGKQFSRSEIILSQQKLSQLDYFQNSMMDVKMKSDTISNTIDIEYIVKEKISDKLYISGGYGTRLVGTVGFDFKNFAGKDVFKKDTRWNPLPAGGGQHLSLKGQTDGVGYYGTSFNFYEPWLKGKPIGFSLDGSYASIKDSIGHLDIINFSSTISHKPFKGDPFTYANYSLGYRHYNPDNFDVFGLTSGKFNAVTFEAGLLKNTTYGGPFPIRGSRIETSVITSLPPYSRFTNNEALTLTNEEKFKWFEYYKFKLSFKNYQSFGENKSVVLASKFGIGYLGYFNKNIGTVPFQRYIMGGTGLANFDITANDYIGLRGYEAGDISTASGDPLALKLSFELQKKVFTSERFMMESHLFGETGNTYTSLLGFDPYKLYSAIGFGTRVYAPVVGVIGIDVGWGVNKIDFSWKIPTVQFTLGLDIGDF